LSSQGQEKSDSEDKERAEDMSKWLPLASRGAAFAMGLVAGCSIVTLLLAANAHHRHRREQRDVRGLLSLLSYDQRCNPLDELLLLLLLTHRPLPLEICLEMLSQNSPIFHLWW
jgi:hypothetical protein